MHMADALLSPVVGGSMWLATTGVIAFSSNRVKRELDDRKVPLMGVLGAFIFAAQMINFAIPATGSSGHLGGGLLLAIILGPHAALLAMASVLTVQALFFADGGLLALGSNIFNLGFLPCFVAYPFIYKVLTGNGANSRLLSTAAIVAAVVALQLGAFSVVVQTTLSGISALPFQSFLLMMQPVHLVIGLVEGLATAGIVSFIRKSRPEILNGSVAGGATGRRVGYFLFAVLTAALLLGIFSPWFSSDRPDGLEWSIENTAGQPAPGFREQGLLARLQEKTSLFPGYGRQSSGTDLSRDQDKTGTWPRLDRQASMAGLLGGVFTLILMFFVGVLLGWRRRRCNGDRANGCH